MRRLILFLLFVWAYPLVAQPVKIKFAVQAEITTELTSVTDIHVMTTQGAYNFNEIRTMSFWGNSPDSTTINLLRNNGIGVYLKGKFLKPNAGKSDRAWEAKVKGTMAGNDTIRMERSSFYYGSTRMGTRDILSLLEGNPGSHAEASLARSNYNTMRIVSFVAGLMIGWPLGEALAGKEDPQWGLAASGALILVGAGIPLSSQFKRHAESAIKIYNRRTPATGSAGLSIQFLPSMNGGTLLVKF